MTDFPLCLSLAWRNYRRQWLFSLCAVCSLAAFLVPLLTLLGVKTGVIGTLTARLLNNPRNLELTPVGAGRFGRDFFQDLALSPDTAFVIPQTRSLAAVIQLQADPAGEAHWVEISATGPGDPLLAEAQAAPVPAGWPAGQVIYLSAAAAEKLGFQPGRPLRGSVSRKVQGRQEKAELDLAVAGVIPRHLAHREAAFGPLTLLEMAEDYRDGFAAPLLGWPGKAKPPGPENHAGFRLYARDLDGVERLRLALAAQGLEVYTKAEEIALVRSLDNSFTVVFMVLGLVVGLGAFASVSSSALDQVAKMRRSLALMRLMGFDSGGLMVFTLSQAALTGLLASALANGLFLLIAVVLNRYFGPGLGFGESVCRLGPGQLLAATGASLVFMLAAAATAGWKLSGLEPAEGMRDV